MLTIQNFNKLAGCMVGTRGESYVLKVRRRYALTLDNPKHIGGTVRCYVVFLVPKMATSKRKPIEVYINRVINTGFQKYCMFIEGFKKTETAWLSFNEIKDLTQVLTEISHMIQRIPTIEL